MDNISVLVIRRTCTGGVHLAGMGWGRGNVDIAICYIFTFEKRVSKRVEKVIKTFRKGDLEQGKR